jgi:four helix bundle protein
MELNRQSATKFDHEKLEVYRFELEFIEWVTPLLDEATASAKGRTREVCDQLDRASLSALLNTAEGNGKRQRPVRAKFFDDARGSATECAACLDALVAKRVVLPDRIGEGKNLLLKIVSMLSGLVNRFDGSSGVLQEDTAEYTVEEATV